MAKTKRKSKPVSQASLEALVRYRPQFDALTQLGSDALSTRNSTISAANTVAASVRKSLQDARAPMAGIYDKAIGTEGGIQSGIKDDLAGLQGPAADAIRAAAISEAAGARSQLGTARTRSQQDITDQIGRVGAGQQQAVIQAGSKYASDLDKIASSRTSLAAQLGDFEQLTGAKLAKEERDRLFSASQKDIDRRISLMKSGINPDTGAFDPTLKPPAKVAAGAKGRLPGGVKLATPGQHGTARKTIEETRRWIREQRAADPSVSRHELAQEGTDGAPAATIKRKLSSEEIKNRTNAQTNEPLTLTELRNGIVTEKIPAISKVDPDLLSAALDVEYDGGVSHGQGATGPHATTAEKLHLRGLSVKGLGYGLTDHSKKAPPKKKPKAKAKSSNIFAFPSGG